jgi:hypothetical protein
MRSLAWFVAALPLACLSAACGGATPTDLFAAPTAGSDAGPLDSGAFDSGHADTTLPDVGTSPVDSAPPPDTAPPPTMPQDTGTSTPGTLPCGQGQPDCPVGPEEVCCVSGTPGMLNFSCSDQNMCGQQGGVPVSCSTPAQCPGETCCGTESGSGGNTHYVGVQCAPACNGVEFCDPAAPACKGNATCEPSTLLPGYYVCRN